VIEEDRKLNINRCSYVEGSIDDDDYDCYNKNIINNDGCWVGDVVLEEELY